MLNFGTKIDLPTPFAQLELYKNRLSDVSAQVGGLRPFSVRGSDGQTYCMGEVMWVRRSHSDYPSLGEQ